MSLLLITNRVFSEVLINEMHYHVKYFSFGLLSFPFDQAFKTNKAQQLKIAIKMPHSWKQLSG